MLALFIAKMDSKVKILNIEPSLQKQASEPVYTFDVLMAVEKQCQAIFQDFSLSFILGPDNYRPEIWQKFYRYQEIEQNWSLFVAKERVVIHSSRVRELMLTTLEPLMLKKALSNLVCVPIADYIIEHQLYR